MAITNLSGSNLFAEYLKKKDTNAADSAAVIMKEQIRNKVKDLMNSIVHSDDFQNGSDAITVLPYDVGNVIFGKEWKTMDSTIRAGWVSFITNCIKDFKVDDVEYNGVPVVRTGRKTVFYCAPDLSMIFRALESEGIKAWLEKNPARKAELIAHMAEVGKMFEQSEPTETQEQAEAELVEAEAQPVKDVA